MPGKDSIHNIECGANGCLLSNESADTGVHNIEMPHVRCSLLDMELDTLSEFMSDIGEKPYRAKQLWKWLYSGVTSFDEMSDLPLTLKNKLRQKAEIGGLVQEAKKVSQDGTIKYLFRLHDGGKIESVLMRYKFGLSACLSTQVGCRMGCKFCASAYAGFSRNLTSGEIMAQALYMMRDAKERISHIVLMGIGEPFDNYDNVMQFLVRANREDTLGISYRKLTVSTCGVVPGIRKFAESGIPVNLSVSLHAPTQDLRAETMPVAQRWRLEDLIEACCEYVKLSKRRITFEYALIQNWNDTAAHAKALADLCKKLLCHVNLIPINPVPGTQFSQTAMLTVRNFQKLLEDKGIQVTVRRELGKDIGAACGQLRRDGFSEENIVPDLNYKNGFNLAGKVSI